MSSLTAIPFFLGGLFLWLCDLLVRGSRTAQEVRLSFLRSSCLWGGILVFLTELLNLRHDLAPRAVANSWLVVMILLASGLLVLAFWRLGLFRLAARRGFAALPTPEVLPHEFFHRGVAAASSVFRRMKRSPQKTIFWTFLVLWILVLLVIALTAAPNTTDSMTYRLTRVMHWVNNRSIDFFPTEMLRQNHRSPLVEWICLHLFLLVRDDRLFNLVQWFSFVGMAVAVYELTAMFSPSRATRYIALLLAVTTPMAVLQATSTQSDLLSSFMLLSFLIFGLRMAFCGNLSMSERMGEAVFCGLALGLGLLAKATNFLYCGVFSLWITFMMLKRLKWRVIPVAAPCALLAVLLIAGHSLRNYQMFHHFLGPPGDPPFRAEEGKDPDRIVTLDANDEMNARFFISNLVRNTAMHLQTPIKNLNDSLEDGIWKFHRALGMTPGEPAITFPGSGFQPTDLRHEDVTGNPLQAALFVAAFISLPLRRKSLPRGIAIYGLCVFAAYLCVSMFLKWQPWHTRLELPLFLAACSFIAVVLPFESCEALLICTAAATAVYSFPFLVDNCKRPLFGIRSVLSAPRELEYFDWDYAKLADFRTAARLIKELKFHTIGIQADRDSFYYPLWAMLRKQTKRDIKIHQVNVANLSGKLPAPPPPDAVLAVYPLPELDLKVNKTSYKKIWQGRVLSLFQKAGGSP